MTNGPKENEIQNQILGYLKLKNVYCWRNNSQGTFDPVRKTFRKPPKYFIKGVSDILGITTDGTFLAIEVKRPGNKPSPQQAEFLANVKKNGGIAFVAYSLRDVQDALIDFLNV